MSEIKDTRVGALEDAEMAQVAGGADSDEALKCPRCGSANVHNAYKTDGRVQCYDCGFSWEI